MSNTPEFRKRSRTSPWTPVFAVVAFAVVLGVAGFYAFKYWDDSKHTLVPTASVSQLEDETAENTACEKFVEAELKCSVEWVADETQERGNFISQSPPADERVLKGTSVTLTYSKGPAESTLPELRNETVESANEILYPMGITVVEESVVNDSGLSEGRIVSGDPDTGSKVKNGSEVKVTVSSGKVTIPEWVGEPKETVEADALTNNISVTFEEVETDGPPGIVISQSESGITEMTTTVTVEISTPKKVEEIPVPKVVGKSLEEAQTLLVTSGFTEINVIREENDEVKEPVVVRVSPGEGKKAPSDSAVTITVHIPKSE